jgi:hypothetical protein
MTNGTRLTPAVLSKLPLGLLGFFGIKNGGQYPQTLGQTISPDIDVMDLLAVNYRELLAMSVTPAGLGFTQQVNLSTALAGGVPTNEVWLINAYSVNLFTGAGDSITCSTEVRNFQSGMASNWHRAMSDQFTQGAGLNTMRQCAISGSPWLAPGDIFGVWVSALVNASGTVTVSSNISVTKFPL